MYACFGLIHLHHTELTQSQTPRQLCQRGVRLHINWVNAEWESTLTESTQKTPTFTKILSFRVDSVDVESHSALTLLTWSLTWRWLSWRGTRLRVNWVTAECKKIRISLISAKNEDKKSLASAKMLRNTEELIRFATSCHIYPKIVTSIGLNIPIFPFIGQLA
jgi:hypothetical protein